MTLYGGVRETCMNCVVPMILYNYVESGAVCLSEYTATLFTKRFCGCCLCTKAVTRMYNVLRLLIEFAYIRKHGLKT